MSTQPAAPARASALAGLLRSGARWDRSQSNGWVALRNAAGIAAPIAIAVATGSPASAGLAPTIGALQTSFADRPGPYRLRFLRMLTTAAAAGVTSGLAVLASRSDAASVLLLGALALAAGLLLAGGPSATQVGVASVATALLLGHLPQSPSHAVHVGLLVLAGGAGQAVLAVAAWPLGRHRPERLALASMYRELAALTRAPLGTSVGPPNVAVLTEVRQVLYGLGHDYGPAVEAYRVLFDEGERVRREVLVLGALLEQLERPERGGAADDAGLRDALDRVADVLDAIAAALERGRPVDPAVLLLARATAGRVISALDDRALPDTRAAADRLRALTGQVRAAVETAAVGASEGRASEDPPSLALRALRSPVAILRANLSPDSAVLRHAVRLAVLLAGADLVIRIAGYGRGYWVPLTVLVVLRPDFGSTFQRATLRTAGTVVGLLVATGLVHWLPESQWYEITLVAVLAFGLRVAGPVNVGYAAIALSGLVVVLLEIEGVSASQTAPSRALATLVGGALALAATLVRPSWERQVVGERLATLVGAYRTYLHTITDPAASEDQLQDARGAARLARSNAQASLDRARAEPVAAGVAIAIGTGVLAHSHRLIHALLSLDALRPALPAVPVPALADFLDASEHVLVDIEHALRGGVLTTASSSTTTLRALQTAVVDQLRDPAAANEQAAAADALVQATDRIANSIDTLLAQLPSEAAR